MNETNKIINKIPVDNYDCFVPNGLKLFGFQHEGVDFLVNKQRGLLASDPGLGKTVQLITACNVLYRNRGFNKVLVLCPKVMKLTWEREAKKWAYPNIDFTVANYDQLISSVKLNNLMRNWDILICDESHCAIKNPKAQRCKNLIDKIIPNCKVVWVATATPASKSSLDYYCTLKLLLPDTFSKVTAWQFQTHFCKKVANKFSRTGYSFDGFSNTDELKSLFSRCSLRHKKEIVLPDLPEKIESYIEIEVDKQTVENNIELNEEELIQGLADGKVPSSQVKSVLQANGLAKIDSCVEWVSSSPKADSLVIFAWHRAVIEQLKDKLIEAGNDVDVIHGGVTDTARNSIIDRFQAGTLRIVICNMQSGGVGITLTKASTCLYLEFPYSPIFLVQSQARIHRIGSTGKCVNINYLVGKHTIDERVFQVLNERIKYIKEIEG